MEGKRPRARPRTRWEIIKDIQMKGEIGKKYKKSGSERLRDSLRFLCNSQPISLETMKNDDDIMYQRMVSKLFVGDILWIEESGGFFNLL